MRPDVLLSAHVDVVRAMDQSQFVPRCEKGRIYGSGFLIARSMLCCVHVSCGS